jgi:hypothetical protein
MVAHTSFSFSSAEPVSNSFEPFLLTVFNIPLFYLVKLLGTCLFAMTFGFGSTFWIVQRFFSKPPQQPPLGVIFAIRTQQKCYELHLLWQDNDERE